MIPTGHWMLRTQRQKREQQESERRQEEERPVMRMDRSFLKEKDEAAKKQEEAMAAMAKEQYDKGYDDGFADGGNNLEPYQVAEWLADNCTSSELAEVFTYYNRMKYQKNYEQLKEGEVLDIDGERLAKKLMM